ncbi:MAG: hypothetical protein N5P05_002891 [Chroococcopsis gigantea SAG 12.99]|jgi:hypothetical protein|nr:DUF3611 family protein [Chlorogloea purpurea SAG 13.99]MDV3001285.1 hypothetical protein [Chroococcopsis gigantea SAG 12.99]
MREKRSQITNIPMKAQNEFSPSLPPAVQRAASILMQQGRIGFWAQIVLGVISAVLLLIASASLIGFKQRTQGIEIGVLCAIGGVGFLVVAIIFAYNYMRIAKQMVQLSSENRPKKADTIRLIRRGLMANITGMFLTILGAQALAGIVLIKSLNVPQGTFNVGTNPTQFVNSVDLLIVQANTNTILAHFTGIVTSLWLLNRITNNK